MSPSLLAAPKGGRDVPSSRYRVHDLLPLLAERGWEVATLTPSMRREGRLGNLFRDAGLARRRWDVVLIQRPGRRREELPLLRLACTRARLIVLDVDDPVDERPAFAWALRRADLVLAGSHALMDSYGGRGLRAELVPTSLDASSYERASLAPPPPTIGWIGDGPAYGEPLVRLVAAVAGDGRWTLRIVGTRGDAELEERLRSAAGKAPLELVAGIDWQDEGAVAREVGRFAVGLSPLRSAEGASFKTVQYLAAGAVPLVEAGGEGERHARLALGSDALVVPPGDTAAVAAALSPLEDERLRASLAERCRAAARRHYSREAVAERIDGLLRGALDA
jgi:glycosyltransferase involved in cell wall biosynthesis